MEQIDGDGSGQVEFAEFEVWWKRSGFKAVGFDDLINSRDPGLMELQVWLDRQGVAPQFMRVFIGENIRSLHDLYEKSKAQLSQLLMGRIGLSRSEARPLEAEIAVRRELLGYILAEPKVDEKISIEQRRRDRQQKLKREGGRDWRNAMELRPGPTLRRAVHKPLPCNCLPAPVDHLEAARAKARGRAGAGAVRTVRRQPMVMTHGRRVQLRPSADKQMRSKGRTGPHRGGNGGTTRSSSLPEFDDGVEMPVEDDFFSRRVSGSSWTSGASWIWGTPSPGTTSLQLSGRKIC